MNEILWAVTRASALLAVALLTTTLVLGTLTSARVARSVQRRAVIASVHRTLSLVMISFVAVHVVTAVVDSYVDIGWLSAVVPFTSDYDRGWIGLGTITLDLVLTVIITSLLRDRMPVRTWRLVHLAAYAMWPIALLHGFGSVTTAASLTCAVLGGCAIVGLTAIGVRLVQLPADSRRRRAVAAQPWRVDVRS